MVSKIEIGRQYRNQTLVLLAQLGYASTRQIAMGLFGGCNISDRKHASRILRRLIQLGLLVERRDNGNASGERLVALNRAGVAALAEVTPLTGNRPHARDWLRHAHQHRTSCNSVWTALHRGIMAPGWTELEIRNGDAPSHLSSFQFRMDGEIHQKIPDLLLTHKWWVPSPAPIWVEVEQSWRGAKDFDKIIGFLRAMFNTDQPAVHEVWFVITAPGAKTIGKRIRSAMTHSPQSGYSILVKRLDARILEKHIKIFELNADTLDLNDILW